ncbi:MAG: subclass B1 metallo-beta-lactamase [Bacteroidetes bacterium]|nr:MAG: subclass B1 metallo-beta-lactamase [Bacteroidota bacterium]
MGKYAFLLVLLCVGFAATAQTLPQTEVTQIGEDIQLLRLTEHTLVHRSFTTSETYGRYASNGLLYIVDTLCIIFDTPATAKTTTRLLDYLTQEQGLTVRALVVNHFHDDCTSGLDSVHARGIPTYGNRQTIALCKANGKTPPQKKMGKRKTLKIGGQQIENYYPGAAHSTDNIVSYLPAEKVLFGGCMVKSLNADFGNTEDADLAKWSKTVTKVKHRYTEAEIVVPGHGYTGGQDLLDYTIQLFMPAAKQ